ncbi:MAG: neuromedin U [Bryobacteraceae bacterium]
MHRAAIRAARSMGSPSQTLGLAMLIFLGAAAAFAEAPRESPPLATNQGAQETPEEAKKEAQKPDTKASAGDLAKAVQNPVASLISVPVQNLTDFNVGPYKRDRNTVLQFQPVIPFQLGANWNLITRIIIPVISQPDITQAHTGTFGLSDTNPSFFLSPAKTGTLIWGAGPTFLVPTATDNSLGTGKFSVGPTVVALLQPGKWTLGILVNNLFSVAGPKGRPDVNVMTTQYFINYNLNKGCYLTSQPIVSANWNAPSGNVWLVPFGGGIGRIMRLGFQPVNVAVQAYGNVKRPDNFPSPTWQLKFQVAFLYPKRPKEP